MTVSIRLPESELEIIQAVWACKGKISCAEVMSHINRDWKAPTVVNLLNRLVEKGFLKTEKQGSERIYFPIISEEEYLKFETNNFISRLHHNSFSSLFTTLCNEKGFDDKDLEELRKLIDEKSRG